MKKIVIKIGTGVLTGKGGNLDEEMIEQLVKQICGMIKSGISVLLVSSGAIGAGMDLLGVKKRPNELSELQSMAAVGQTRLMNIYNKYFNKNGYIAGQILLTQDDFDDRTRYINIKHTINALLERKIIPIVNENDTISTEEIKCGDNDRISALLGDLVEADTLVILTNVEGLLDREGKLIRSINDISDEIKSLVRKDKCALGTGGMETKINAAEFVTNSGIDCCIANGKSKDILLDILKGEGKFTYFKAKSIKVTAKKRWIGFGSKTKGAVIVDDGAKEAISKGNKSLLAAGVIDKKGDFLSGDILSICDKSGKEFAKGITNYSSSEILKIKGIKTKDIESALGYKNQDEVIHRDNLVIL